MTKHEAIQQLKKGKKLTHRFFDADEYIHLIDDEIHDENGININKDFWKYRTSKSWLNDWEIYTGII